MVDVPYTFTAGTTARASEVNANFKALLDSINNDERDISNNTSEIEILKNDKAYKEGNADIQFHVKTATEPTHAINKAMLETYLGNFMNYISGLVIKKDESDSTGTTILVSSGQCYNKEDDSDETRYILRLDNETSATNSSQEANKEYYVFIQGTKDNSGIAQNVSITFSITGDAPPSVTQNTVYRCLGYYNTDSSGKINVVFPYSSTQDEGDKVFVAFDPALTLGSNVQVNLTTVLPADYKTYYVYVYCHKSGIGSGATSYVESDVFPKTLIVRCDSDASRNSHSQALVPIPVGNGRWIRLTNSGSAIGYIKA